MHHLLSHFAHMSFQEAVQEIFHRYETQKYVVINYVYGANITARKLFDSPKNELTQSYYDALIKSDFLFPDGIAMQIFLLLYMIRFHKKVQRYHSVNGTDFLPYLLEKTKKKYHLKLVLYGAYPHDIKRSAFFLKHQGYEVFYYQDGYCKFNWNAFEKKKEESVNMKSKYSNSTKEREKKDFRIFIQGRTTLTDPIQERRTTKNMDKIRQHHFVVCNQ